MDKKQTIKERYEQQTRDRSQYIDRSQRYSQLTIPYVCQDKGETGKGRDGSSDTNELGWQSFGAQAVNNLSNKMDTTLFPPQRSFFRLEFSNKAKRALRDAGVESDRLSPALSKIEGAALAEQGQILPRNMSVLSFKHLIITGNALLYAPNNKPFSVYGLRSYTVRRDYSGNVLEVILCQKTAFSNIPMDKREQVRQAYKQPSQVKDDTQVELYTQALVKGDGKYKISQEAEGVLIGPVYSVKQEDLPFRVLVWNLNPGEHYGRGLAEDYAGDLYVIAFLSEAVAKGMVLMSDIKYLVKPNSYTDLDHLVNSPTGEFVTGNIDDIGVLQLERYADFTPIQAVIEKYQQRVGEAFLLTRAIRRDAERVTAYEIQRDAQDLEASLGGVYSHFAETYQKPLAQQATKRAIKVLGELIPGHNFSDALLAPQILTGIEALGRMNELDKIMQFGEMLQATNAWPQSMQQRVKWDVYCNKVASQLSLEIDWVMSDQEYQQLMAAQQRQMQEQTLLEGAAKAIPDAAKGAMNGR